MATITEIKAEQLRHSDTPEGLILQGCGGDLNIQTAAGQRLGGRLEGAGVDCSSAQIAAVAVHAVYGVPSMGQVDGFGLTLTFGKAEGPALIEGIQVSHEKISFRCLP